MYIRGKEPIILSGSGVASANKVCLYHSAWDDGIKRGKRPFVDSQNPSVMSLRLTAESHGTRPRLEKDRVQALVNKYGENRLERMFIASVTVGNGQCRWGESEDEIEKFRISDVEKAPTVHGELLVLDENFNRLEQTSIKLLSDSKWGRMKQSNKKQIVELDDTRLFFYDGSLWLFYRNGKNLGYTEQAHNPLYIERDENGNIEAYIKASEMVKVCCGRNMAIIASERKSQMMVSLPLFISKFRWDKFLH